MDHIPCVLMRGGSSKGLFFLAESLPDDTVARDRLLLAAMGSPDLRQIDGMGGGNDLSSKVVIVARDFQNMLVIVDQSVRVLIRWAAHSARNSEQEIPQTFSV